MTLPVRHRPGILMERAFPGREPMAAEFEDLFERLSRFMQEASTMPALTERMAWAPMADLSETDEAYVVECELPGIKRDDIDIEVSERELCITGEYKEREREGVLRRATRRTGRFEYRALLPTAVKAGDVSASLADGILKVTVPKTQAVKSHHIKITG